MAPHSKYDPLHLVPKMLNEPSPLALDSRGAFIIHAFSSIFVWIGKNCEPAMEKDAKTAAYQVVRYEKVQGTIVTVEEGEEPSEFWEAFSSISSTEDNNQKIDKEIANKVEAGKRNVEMYNSDFELFYQAIKGGIVPPFSSSGGSDETHVPARESNWSILRRKFISGAVKEWVSTSRAAMCRVYSDSFLMRDTDSQSNRIQRPNADSSISLHFSPNSLSSDTSTSSKCSSDSPSFSPSTSSPSPSPVSSNLSYSSLCPSKSLHPESKIDDSTNVKACPPSKALTSLAERRGRISPLLKLSPLNEESCQSSARVRSPESVFLLIPESLAMGNNHHNSNSGLSTIPLKESGALSDESSCNSSEKTSYSLQYFKAEDLLSLPRESAENNSTHFDPLRTLVYRWPGFQEIQEFDPRHSDLKNTFLFLAPNKSFNEPSDKVLYVCIASCLEHSSERIDVNSMNIVEETSDIDWNAVGNDFLKSMGLPKHTPIKVIQGNDPALMELLNVP